jgi:23S rRNA pseudouridine2605 synthase
MRDRPALRIVGAIIEARDSGMGDGARAHRAGFQRDIEVTAVEPFVAELRRGRPNRYNLRMRGGIVRFARAVMAFGHDRPVLDDDRTDRHFAPIGGDPGKVERAAHGFGKQERGHFLPLIA